MKKLLVLIFLLSTATHFAQKKEKVKGSKIVTIEQKTVENFKSITASAIDEIAEVERRVKSASKDNPELGDFLRECATAKTALQDASMWGVAALTHQITFDTFEN